MVIRNKKLCENLIKFHADVYNELWIRHKYISRPNNLLMWDLKNFTLKSEIKVTYFQYKSDPVISINSIQWCGRGNDKRWVHLVPKFIKDKANVSLRETPRVIGSISK